VRETQCSSTSWSILTLLFGNFLNNSGQFRASAKALRLATPHREASFRVRLDFHRIAPFLRFCALLFQLLALIPNSWEALELAAPQCVARFCVRLNLHRLAPFRRFCAARLLSALLLYCLGSPRISCPTMRCRLSCSS